MSSIGVSKSSLQVAENDQKSLSFSDNQRFENPLIDTPISKISHLEADRGIISVGKTQSVKVAFHKLIDNSILSIPVFDNKRGTYTTFIDILDILTYVMDSLNEDAVKAGYETFSSNPKFSGNCTELADASSRNPFRSVAYTGKLSTIVNYMSKFSLHRIAVVDKDGQLLDIITQSRVVRFVNDQINRFPFANETIKSLNLGFKDVISVLNTDRALDAFKVINDNNISGVAVVDAANPKKLVSNLSASDMKRLGYDTYLFCNIFLPVSSYLGLTGANESTNTNSRAIFVTEDASIKDVFQMFTETGVHRLYIVNNTTDQHLIGVISLGDLIDLLNSSL